MSPGGDYRGAININFAAASISLNIGGHSVFVQDDDYYFGAYSWGFHTNL